MLVMISTKLKSELSNMMWLDYTVEQIGEHFTVKGDWPGEVMGWTKDGERTGGKTHVLYQPGDVFVVNANGILKKVPTVAGDVLMVTSSGDLVPFARDREGITL